MAESLDIGFRCGLGAGGWVLIIGIAGRATGISAIDARYQWATNARPVREAQRSQMEAGLQDN